MGNEQDIDYEHFPAGTPMDETDISLRAYLSSLSDEHLAKYDPNWTDEQVIGWDDNFRSDGTVMLVCCERDVDIVEFRRVLEEHLSYRRSAVRVDEKSLPRAGKEPGLLP